MRLFDTTDIFDEKKQRRALENQGLFDPELMATPIDPVKVGAVALAFSAGVALCLFALKRSGQQNRSNGAASHNL